MDYHSRERGAEDGITMNSVVGSLVPSGDVTSRATLPGVSLFRLYTLRASYLVLAVGLGVYIWPVVLHHTNEFAATRGAQCALLAGLGATAALGLRYPVQMLPLLLFEMIWKAIYLIAFALPLWSAHQINAAAEDIKACLMVVIFIPLIPWRYVFAHYVLKHGDRWK
ncbi:MAG: hypothetical protein ACLQOO_11190 [Terriglobia bacterium]